MNERVWTEARLKAEELLPAVDAALVQLGGSITAEEKDSVLQLAAAVRDQLDSSAHDPKALKAATQQLDDATQTLAVMLIEKAMDDSLERRGLV